MQIVKKFLPPEELTQETETTKKLFWENEVHANLQVAVVLLLQGIGTLICWLLDSLHVYELGDSPLTFIHLAALPTIPAILCFALKGERKWLKYFQMTCFVLIMAFMDFSFSFNVTLLMLFPMVLSCRYYSKKLTMQVAVLTVLFYGLSAWYGVTFNPEFIDLNVCRFPQGTVLKVDDFLIDAVLENGFQTDAYRLNYMKFSFLPRLLIFLIMAVSCVLTSGFGRRRILNQANLSAKNARMDSELSYAKQIQSSMLPNAFPPFALRNRFDLYASMRPAREVGGDFYDYFPVDDTHAAIVIGDVSGKGVPAALFMMRAKTTIRDFVLMGLKPSQVFSRSNNALCADNDAELFVTAWLGIIDCETGEMTYSNAGHNPPALKQKNGFGLLKNVSGPMLGGFEDVNYKEHTLKMNMGDRILLYTDGIPEAATVDRQLYGNDRMIAYLNAHSGESAEALADGLQADADAFSAEAEQFDDMTLLLFDYLPQGLCQKQTFDATEEGLSRAMDFLTEHGECAGIPQKTAVRLNIALEELAVNVVRYAYPREKGSFTVEITSRSGETRFILTDQGVPFNPLERPEPDTTLPEEERSIGGLGIFMAKKSLDSLEYEYCDGNRMTGKIRWVSKEKAQ